MDIDGAMIFSYENMIIQHVPQCLSTPDGTRVYDDDVTESYSS